MKRYAVFTILAVLLSLTPAVCSSAKQNGPELRQTPYPKSELNLREIPFKIVYETYRKTSGRNNWELYVINADGSNPVNLTNTPDVDELYPHACPDGSKICFAVDEGIGRRKIRNVYYMNIDGTGRAKIADNARQPCWGPDSKTIAYLKGEFDRYTIKDYSTTGIFFYDVDTKQHREHENKSLYHLYNICWSPCGRWFLATVHGGMGHKHANLAIQADGKKVYDLTKFGVTGCRPDFSNDGSTITWGLTDWDLCVADITFESSQPQVTNVRRLIKCRKQDEAYHTDFSPDGKFIVFSHGPKANEMVGGKAPGWNICVGDMSGKWVQITTDGNHNKEPDWVAVHTSSR
jgi:Tol biopolymer transport system component